MDDLRRQIEAEKENIESALKNLRYANNRKKKTVVEIAALATFLHNIYNGIENILKQILLSRKIIIPRSQIWHKELLNAAKIEGIVSEDLHQDLYEYLSFRHFFVHSYGFMIEYEKISGLIDRIHEVYTRFMKEITHVI